MAKNPALQKQASTFWFERLTQGKKDVVCVLVLFGIILLIFGKIVFGDMLFAVSGDTAVHNAWAEGIKHIRETEHVDPLWMPYLFSGMPVFAGLLYPKSVNYLETLIQIPGKLLFLNGEVSWFVLHFFLLGLFTYLLARQVGFSSLPSLLGAVTVMINPYAVSLAIIGHGSKLITLSYVPLLFLATFRLIQKRTLLNFGFLAAVAGTLILSRHPQIAFYGLLMCGAYVLYEIVMGIRQKPAEQGMRVLLFGLAIGIGFSISAYESLPTMEYANYSIRGGSETGVSKGLDYDYATNWSFHPLETLTYLNPGWYGFSSSYMVDLQGRQEALPLYWGYKPSSDTPIYVGLVPLFLAALALFYNRTRMAIWLGFFSLLVLLLSYGKNFGLLYNPMFNYFPYFNKLRAPEMILQIMPVPLALLAANGAEWLGEVLQSAKGINLEKFKKNMKLLAIACVAVAGIAFIAKSGLQSFLSGFMFTSPGDRGWEQQAGPAVLKMIRDQRYEVFWNYLVWGAVLGAGIFGLSYAYFNKKVGWAMYLFLLTGILTLDLALIDAKFIDPQPREALVVPFRDDPTVRRLMAESDTSVFRVLPVWGLREQDNTLMNFHLQMVTGYSPAKLKIYMDLMDSCFSRGNRNVYDMLNVKYFLIKQRDKNGAEVIAMQENPACLPRAWFVDTAAIGSSKGDVFARMNAAEWNPRETAILEKAPASPLAKPVNAAVKVTKYASSDITISTSNDASSLLVLGDIYYPAGWKAAIDGKEAEIYKTNFVLRSVIVPAGNHTVEYRFEPETYARGEMISEGAWGVTALMLLAGLFLNPAVRKRLGKSKGEAPPAS